MANSSIGPSAVSARMRKGVDPAELSRPTGSIDVASTPSWLRRPTRIASLRAPVTSRCAVLPDRRAIGEHRLRGERAVEREREGHPDRPTGDEVGRVVDPGVELGEREDAESEGCGEPPAPAPSTGRHQREADGDEHDGEMPAHDRRLREPRPVADLAHAERSRSEEPVAVDLDVHERHVGERHERERDEHEEDVPDPPGQQRPDDRDPAQHRSRPVRADLVDRLHGRRERVAAELDDRVHQLQVALGDPRRRVVVEEHPPQTAAKKAKASSQATAALLSSRGSGGGSPEGRRVTWPTRGALLVVGITGRAPAAGPQRRATLS